MDRARDGSGQPRKFLSQAESPVVLRSALAVAAPPAPGLTLRATDLGVVVTASASEVPVGGEVRYTATVTNHGPGDATSLKIDHLLPPNVPVVGTPTATDPAGRGYGCAVHGEQGRISCDTTLLPSGGPGPSR